MLLLLASLALLAPPAASAAPAAGPGAGVSDRGALFSADRPLFAHAQSRREDSPLRRALLARAAPPSDRLGHTIGSPTWKEPAPFALDPLLGDPLRMAAPPIGGTGALPPHPSAWSLVDSSGNLGGGPAPELWSDPELERAMKLAQEPWWHSQRFVVVYGPCY